MQMEEEEEMMMMEQDDIDPQVEFLQQLVRVLNTSCLFYMCVASPNPKQRLHTLSFVFADSRQ